MLRAPCAVKTDKPMRLSRTIHKLSWPINALKYKGIKGIHSRKEFYKIIEQERERANRNNHQVSLVIFNLESFPDNGKESKQLIRNIIKEKRKIDELGWYKKHRVGVILPYTTSYGARKFSVRLSRTLNFIMPDSFCYLFTYPLEEKTDDAGNKADDQAENIADNDAENNAADFDNSTDDSLQNASARSVSL
jgi:hypothetical protein